ncbi:MAG: hypothetical protein O2854_06655, partial [Chloroflexi bacterium]|nr:hypothetical protein [Chloroflexota bacterium]
MIEAGLVGFAFTAGTVAAFNPCGAAMFPAYVGYQLASEDENERKHPVIAGLGGLMTGLAATAGFIVVFGVVGVALAFGIRAIGNFLPFVGLAVGIIIAGLGLWLLISRKKIGIMAASRVNLGAGKGLKNIFLFGIAYAIASLSCALPIFLAAVGIVAGQSFSADLLLETIVHTLSYGLGMGVIMVAAAVGVVFFRSTVQTVIRKMMRYIEPIGNLAMIGAGVYLIYYWSLGKGSELLSLQ